MKGHIFHTGMDTEAGGFVGPIFFEKGKRRKFEYIPIMEGCPDPNIIALTYEMIQSKNWKKNNLSDFLPPDFADEPVHLDPSFHNFPPSKYTTYGEPLRNGGKAASLWNLDPDDYIFFVSSLAPYSQRIYQLDFLDDKSLSDFQKGRMNKYLFGYMKVQGLARVWKTRNHKIPKIIKNPEPKGKVSLQAIMANAHSRRDSNRYIVAIGDKKDSGILNKAIPFAYYENSSNFLIRKDLRRIWTKSTFDFHMGDRSIDYKVVNFLLHLIERYG